MSKIYTAFKCNNCGAIYLDQPVSECDCTIGTENQSFTEVEVVEKGTSARIAQLEAENAKLEKHCEELTGIPAACDVCEPIEGFAQRPQDMDRCFREVMDKYRKLREVVEKLPKTADGVVITRWPIDLWLMSTDDGGHIFEDEVDWIDGCWCSAGRPLERYSVYSTREAAEQAKKGELDNG